MVCFSHPARRPEPTRRRAEALRTMRRYLLIVATLIIAQGRAVAAADEGLALLPPECTLKTPESVQHLLVQRTAGSEPTRQVTQGIAWSSSDPHVAEVAD